VLEKADRVKLWLGDGQPAALSSLAVISHTDGVDNPSQYHGYRFPPEVISHSLWLYHRLRSRNLMQPL
jgi:hypothetical protein